MSKSCFDRVCGDPPQIFQGTSSDLLSHARKLGTHGYILNRLTPPKKPKPHPLFLIHKLQLLLPFHFSKAAVNATFSFRLRNGSSKKKINDCA